MSTATEAMMCTHDVMASYNAEQQAHINRIMEHHAAALMRGYVTTLSVPMVGAVIRCIDIEYPDRIRNYHFVDATNPAEMSFGYEQYMIG